MLLKDTCNIAAEILEGEHDENLDHIVHAVRARKRDMFRPGTRVRLTGTRNVELEGVEGVVIKANPKTIQVGMGAVRGGLERGQVSYEREFNVPVKMLEVIQ